MSGDGQQCCCWNTTCGNLADKSARGDDTGEASGEPGLAPVEQGVDDNGSVILEEIQELRDMFLKEVAGAESSPSSRCRLNCL